MVIEWTAKAKQQLKNIFDYYAEVAGRKIAKRIVAEISDTTKLLANFPQMAAVEPVLSGFTKTFRSLVVKKTHKVIYYVEGEKIYISAVWDCRQDPDRLKATV
jgi:plasmid stabilization system protein ParE